MLKNPRVIDPSARLLFEKWRFLQLFGTCVLYVLLLGSLSGHGQAVASPLLSKPKIVRAAFNPISPRQPFLPALSHSCTILLAFFLQPDRKLSIVQMTRTFPLHSHPASQTHRKSSSTCSTPSRSAYWIPSDWRLSQRRYSCLLGSWD